VGKREVKRQKLAVRPLIIIIRPRICSVLFDIACKGFFVLSSSQSYEEEGTEFDLYGYNNSHTVFPE